MIVKISYYDLLGNGKKKTWWKEVKKAKWNIKVPRDKTSCTLTWGLCFYIYIDWAN